MKIHTKDFLSKLYVISIAFILFLIACCMIKNPATAFALEDKIKAKDAIVLSDIVQDGGDVPLKGRPVELEKVTDAHYIKNYKYFVNSPKHKINDGLDNRVGTCTTVAMQLILGYHTYYTDRRLISNSEGHEFLSNAFGQFKYNPLVFGDDDFRYSYDKEGKIVIYSNSALGTEDLVYQEIYNRTPLGDTDIGQNFVSVNIGTRSFLSEYSVIANQVDINFSLSYNKDEVVAELDAHRPIILGTKTLSEDGEKSYHVVIAYGYALYEGKFGYICNMGWNALDCMTWVPEDYFHFQNIVRVNHDHTLVDQQVNIENAYRHFKCSECGCDILDDLYEVSADGNTITALKHDPLPDTVLPKIINGKNITGVAKNVFKGTSISSIDLGKCTYLGEGVFENCTLLSEVVFPNGLTMTCIPDNCFKGCSNLSMITLPSTVINIGRAAFEDCSKLTSIGNIINLVNIGAFAFRNCTNLSSFTGYAKLSSIGQGAFAGCNDCSINVLESNSNFCSENNIIYNKDKTIIFGSGKIQSVLDLSSVRTIMGSAFENNTDIQKVYFEQINIEDRAFYGCANLTEVYFDSFSMAELGRDCFTNDSFIAYVPYFMQSSYQYALSTYTDNIVSRQFCVTYFSDGVQKDVTTNYYGEIVSNMPIAIRNGYTFDGWYKTEDCSSGKISEGADEKWQEKNDIVLYAKWNANTYTISFEGTGCENLTHQDVVFNERIGELPIPTQIGYEFEGWKDETGKVVSANDIYQTAGNIILFPMWNAKTYTITFHACGGSPETEIKHCKYNDIFTAFPNVERNGYSLKEWNSAEDGSGKQYKSGFAFAFDSDLNLYAQWNVITYSIVYAMNGGANSASNPTVYTIDSNDIILNPATKSGYSFVGWKKDGSIITKIEKGSFGNIELMAIWQANTYTVTLDANGGVLNGNNTLTVTYDESFAIENGISREGYDFLGWCDIDGVRYANSNGECVKKWDKTENTTLIAEWLVKSYEIQINNNNTITWIGPNGLSTVKSPISYGTVINTINLIAVFKESSQGYKEGHIFDHFEYGNTKIDWDKVPDLGDNGAIITIIPIWKKEKHTIHFQTKDPDLLIPPITIEYDGIISLPENVNRDGYEFNGWSQTDGGSLVSWTRMPDLTPGDQNNGSIDLFAVYTPIEYTVQYVLYDGTNAKDNPLTYNITQNITLKSPSKLGYIFGGWYTDTVFTKRVYSVGQEIGNKVLYAKWSPISYTIKYYANNGSTQIQTSTHAYDKESTLRGNTFEKEGYHFIGWSTVENGKKTYNDCQKISNLSSKNNDVISLFAIWEANQYRVSYNSNGGSGVMQDSLYVYDKADTLRSCTFVKEGYTFMGWTMDSNEEYHFKDGSKVTNLTSINNAVVVLYAKWSPNQYTVSFDKQNGTGGTNSVTVTYDAALPTITPPTRKGYMFKGYYSGKQASGKQYYTGNNPCAGVREYDEPNNITLYAYWEIIKYDVQVYNEDDSIFRTIQVAYGEQMPNFATFAPKKEGYTFNGYFSGKDGNGTQYYRMAFLNDEQTAQINGLDCYYCEKIQTCRTMDKYSGFSLYPSFSPLEVNYTYKIYNNGNVISTQTIYINGANKTTTITAPSIKNYSFSYFTYGFKQYNNSTSSIPIVLSRDSGDKNGGVRLDNVLAAVYNENSCVAPGTLITLANGMQVPVETLTGNEQLLVWNMFTGKFDSAPIVFVDSESQEIRDVINLSFSDGTIVRVISEHAFWDMDMNQYVYLNENAAQYIGHRFNKQGVDGNGNMTWTGVRLIAVTISKEETTTWSPVTYGHLCYYVNGMLSIPGGISGLFNYLSVDRETLTIDQEALAEDIEQYGLFTYEEFSELVTITPEVFDAFNGQYLKIAIGKGMISIDEIQSLLNRYARFF